MLHHCRALDIITVASTSDTGVWNAAEPEEPFPISHVYTALREWLLVAASGAPKNDQQMYVFS